MQKSIFRFFFIIILIINFCSPLLAQEERRVSLSIYGGAAFFPKDKKNNANLPTRALGGFNPTPLIGLGAYFKLTKRLYIGENYMYLFNTKEDNRKLSAHTFRTTLKYYLLVDKKINPYLTGSFNINLVNLDRKAKDYVFTPDPSNNTDVIGVGFAVDSIHYREKALKLSGLPVMGGTIGAGFDFKISKKINVFVEYNLQANFGKGNDLLEKYYFSNQSNFMFHTVTAGVNMKLFKPQKQLLATLTRDDWRNSRSIDVKGTIIYKKPDKPYKKILPVEKTDTLENVLEIDPTDENGVVFFSKNIEFGDYQFMLAKRKRKIIRADLQILNYNRIEIEDDELELDMVEDEGSENILSRDANFAVLLREGFQHEVELTTTAENIMGKYVPVDSNCRVRIILKDQYDSIISYIDTLENNTFNFVDVPPGNYKLAFKRLNNDCKKTEFKYAFTGATPYINSQSNTNEPEDTIASYSINGNVSTSETKQDAPKGTTVKLIDPSGRVESSTALAGTKTNFNYKDLRSPNYNAVYEDPTNKASMNYKVKDKQSNVIRQVKAGPSKKAAAGTIAVAGKVELPNPEQSKTISVLLVDSTGRIKQKAPLNSNGTFSFENLAKNKYKVVYESTDPLVRGKLNYNTIDKSIKINKIILPELTASIEEVDTVHFYKKGSIVRDTTQSPVTNNNKTVVKKTGKTKEVPIRYTYMQFKPGTTYNDLGYEVQPEGYGVQVSSFFINSNLEKFCQRLKGKGEKNIFIQVIQKDKNNPEAGIIYRVIVGADKDREKMLKKVPTYMDKGYDAVLRKHLDVVVPQ
jgi:cell division septation protein DedD